MRGTKWALGFVMVVFGFLMMTQFRAQQQAPVASGTRADDLARMLRAAEEQLEATEQERDRLAAQVARLSGSGEGQAKAPQISPTEILAGTVEVHGPGLVLTLTEGTDTQGARARIADEDLWLVVNELLAAGAEGISVNGNRLTALSGIRNVGQRIMIHQAMTSAPYEVAAIGDPAVMEAALRMRGGVIDSLDKWGIKVKFQRHESIRLPAFRATPTFRFAKPVK